MYPLAFPSIDETIEFQKRDGSRINCRIMLTDGGIYDNLGVSCFDPTKNQEISLNTYNPDYLIICDAGRGMFTGKDLPTWFLPRMSKSFDTVFRKAHDLTISKLFDYNEKSMIDGFILPYLGQNDSALPYRPSNFVTLGEVKEYPTNLSAMSQEMIDKLTNRGEQLSRLLIDRYLPNL